MAKSVPQPKSMKKSTGRSSSDVQISKSMSWLLRHGAQKEGIAMDDAAYVQMSDLLKWLKTKKKLDVSLEHVLYEVKVNEKKRFALKLVPPLLYESGDAGKADDPVDTEAQNAALEAELVQDLEAAAIGAPEPQSKTEDESLTVLALAHASLTPHPQPTHFLIRATQGHSITTIDPTAYATPITLSQPHSIPTTIVHGTFYRFWPSILATGGLKPMTRVHAHFAIGPSPEQALALSAARHTKQSTSTPLTSPTDQKPVISGMRNDAQLLIYIDPRRALEQGVPLSVSENHVVLSEGVPVAGDEGGRRIVPMACWDQVIDIVRGVVVWKDGKMVGEVPRSGEGHGVGRGGGSRGRQRKRNPNAKPRLNVEREVGVNEGPEEAGVER